ncbi:MAG: PAC2 family protein [Deltaproteobacteria bacterium]|nr:PAC2 family protein [Deltaproteobacteria bacterium]
MTKTQDITIFQEIPSLNNALMIMGLDGWGNALNISRGMIEFLIQRLDAEPFGEISADAFYKLDDVRPIVDIQDGILKRLEPPGGHFYFVRQASSGRDLVLLNTTEPNFHWFQFSDSVLSLCRQIDVQTIISLGSMYDNVLHTDTLISAVASDTEILEELNKQNVISIDYQGPTAIHSTLHTEAVKKGFRSICLWCHCPHYLQGTMHFGLLSYLGSFLASLGGFHLDIKELEIAWKDLNQQIQNIIDKNPELQNMIHEIRKAKVRGSWDMSGKKQDKIIQLEDYLKPR